MNDWTVGGLALVVIVMLLFCLAVTVLYVTGQALVDEIRKRRKR